MRKDDRIEILIERAFRDNPWRGIISVEEAIAIAVRYRCELSEQDRTVYDEQILASRHPVKALETVEILAGRNPSYGAEVLQSAASAKAS